MVGPWIQVLSLKLKLKGEETLTFFGVSFFCLNPTRTFPLLKYVDLSKFTKKLWIYCDFQKKLATTMFFDPAPTLLP